VNQSFNFSLERNVFYTFCGDWESRAEEVEITICNETVVLSCNWTKLQQLSEGQGTIISFLEFVLHFRIRRSVSKSERQSLKSMQMSDFLTSPFSTSPVKIME